MFVRKQTSGLLAVLLAAGLTACGGGGSGGDSTPAGVASSSSNSAGASSAASSSAASSSAASSSSVASVAPQTCPTGDSTIYFCDDFQNGSTSNWVLTPTAGSLVNGAFEVVDTADINGATTKALKYTAGDKSANAPIALLTDAAWTAAGNKTNYYVEARIKPLTNGTTGNKQLYMVARYQDATNWYLGGLNVQNSTASTQVEAGYMKAGTITRDVQAKREIVQDSAWYKVRLELSGATRTIYLDGEKIGSKDDAAFTAGKIGLMTANKSFLIDDIKVGDASVKPVQLTISPAALTYVADAGDAAKVVTVSAIKSDGTTADTFSVVSDNPSVVGVSVSGTSVTLTPLAAGTARIKFSSGSDAALSKTIVATIAPKYVDSTAGYNLSGKVYPAVAATGVYADDKLTLTFDSAPTLGTAGTIRIFKKSDDTLVDTIKLSGETDTIGLSTSFRRGVNTTPIRISGNTVTINPHSGKLAYGTEYYIGVSDTAFTGAKLDGKTFAGIGKAANWSFTTKAAPDATKTTITVDDDGSTADYRSVQGALNHAMALADTTSAVTINVKNGTYEELMYIYGRSNVTIKGESRTGVVLQYDNHDSLNSGSGAGANSATTSGGGRAVFMAENADLLRLDTLTLKNTHLRSPKYSNQAEALFFKASTQRLIAVNANFYSEQDTIQVQGYNWFYNTKISGNVDFIWGNNYASLFEDSIIETVGDSQYPASNPSYANGTGGYILQARTNSGGKGFVFLNSSLTYADGPAGVKVATGANASTYLGRSGGSSSYFDHIAFVNCKMDSHIIGLGWSDSSTGQPAPNPATATATTGWREYGSMDMSGNALTGSARSANSKQMNAGDLSTANISTRAGVFSAISWNPVP